MNSQIIYTDLSKYHFTASAGESGVMPLNNLYTYDPNKAWGSGDSTSQTLLMDFGSAKTVDAMIIDTHNLSTFSGSLYLEGCADTNFATTFSLSISMSIDQLHIEQFATQAYRYWRLNYVGTGTENPYIGNIFLDSVIELERNYTFGYSKDDYTYDVSQYVDLNGTLQTRDRIAGRPLLNISLNQVDDAVKTQIRSFLQNVRGRKLPFYWYDSDQGLSYVTLDKDLMQFSGIGYNINELETLAMKGFSNRLGVSPVQVPVYFFEEYFITEVS